MTFAPSLNDLPLSRAAIRRNFGYASAKIPPAVDEAISEVLAGAHDKAELRCGFLILREDDVRILEDRAICRSQTLRLAGVIAPLLRNSRTLAVFVATAGPRMEEWASTLMRDGDVFQGFIVDAIASEIVEQTGDWLERRLAKMVAPRDWKTTNRYSPGYCGWPTEDQRTLFSLLPENLCGIRLTESALMKPVKSISGIIGLGPGLRREGYPCEICEMRDCFKRRVARKSARRPPGPELMKRLTQPRV